MDKRKLLPERGIDLLAISRLQRFCVKGTKKDVRSRKAHLFGQEKIFL